MDLQHKWIEFEEFKAVDVVETSFHANAGFGVLHDHEGVTVAVEGRAEKTEDEFVFGGDLKAGESHDKVEFEIVEIRAVGEGN